VTRGGHRPTGPTSRAFDHAARVYAALDAIAVPAAQYHHPRVPADAQRVAAVNLVPFLRELGYTSTAQYHDVKHHLVDLGCIVQVRRGTSRVTGAWALLRPPTAAGWAATHGARLPPKRLAVARANHTRALLAFLTDARAGRHAQLVAAAYRETAASTLTGGELVAWLVGHGEAWLRVVFPDGAPCLGFAGGPHTCQVADLDPLAASSAGGAWKRRRDHAARLLDELAAADQAAAVG
jgi:hypothetical protein